MGLEDIEALLDDGRDVDLIGLPEANWLDFKQQPYVLSQDKQRWELAKDVASMASNSDGGAIVLGVSTSKRADDFEEVADKIKPFPCHLIDDQQYRDVIDLFAYPPIRGLRIRQFKRDGSCLAMIIVPPQAEDDRPFMLKRIVSSDDDVVEAFAVPSRDGSHTRWSPVGQIHRDLADGRQSRSRARRDNAAPLDIPPTSLAALDERLMAAVDRTDRYMGWQDSAIYALAAAPRQAPDRILNFYGGSLREAFEAPAGLRHAGFGIGWRQDARLEDGSLVASDSDFRVRQLEPDGFFVVAARAEESFLGRVGPRPTGEPRSLKINTTVLVEFTYEFCRFQNTVLQGAVEGSWALALIVRGAQSRTWGLQLGPRSAMFEPDHSQASSDEWLRSIESTRNPESDAFELLAHFYDLFGLPESTIPFTSDRNVDPSALTALSD